MALYTKENPPTNDDFTPGAVQFRADHPEMFEEVKDEKPTPDDEDAEKPNSGVQSAGFTGEEQHHSPDEEKQKDLEPAPRHYD